jgi:hypothetical protein
LYELTMLHMHWVPEGHHASEPNGESLTFCSPWTIGHVKVRGQFKVYYYTNYPKKCVPTSTEYEVEVRETSTASLPIKTRTSRQKEGAIIRIYRKDGECVYPLWGVPVSWELRSELSRRLEEYQTAHKEPPLEPYPPLPMLQGARDGMVHLCHLALACAVKWRSHTIGDLPQLSYLPTPLEKMLKATIEYDRRFEPSH